MDFNSILAICISSPICLTIIVWGLPRIMRRGGVSVAVGNVKASVGKDETPEESLRRRATDNDPFIQELLTQFAAVVKETTHKCAQGALLEQITEGIEILTPTVAALASEAVSRNINGMVKKGADALPGFETRFRAFGRKQLIQEGS